MKTALFSLLALISAQTVLSAAADSQKGIDFFKAGMFIPARQELLNSLNDDPANAAQTCYYLGEVYCALEKPDSASYYYNKGLSVAPEDPYNRIGQAKLLLASDPAQAQKSFDDVLKGKNRKDAGLWLAVARAYFDAGDRAKAVNYIAEARKVDKTCADSYLLEGDIRAAERNYGDACGLYEQAVYFDPSCDAAYLKYAQIYSDINPDSSIKMLQNLLDRNPEAVAAWKQLAETYYKSNRLADARDAYAKYIEKGTYTQAELERYATLLYFSGSYTESLRLVDDLLAKEPSSVVMQRLRMYDLYELQDFAAAKRTGDQFMNRPSASDYICQDYIYYGRLLEKEREHDGAILAFDNALALDSTRVEIHKELGTACENAHDYRSAVRHYRDFIRMGGDNVKVADSFLLGRSAYFAGNDTTCVDTVERIGYLNEADTIFADVARRTPDNYLGYFWRARTNASIDATTELGLAKPYYEQVLPILLQDTVRNSRLIIECYSYLGYYYYLKKDMAESKVYWQKILELDPNNHVALSALDGIK